jgi:hypothetical protein
MSTCWWRDPLPINPAMPSRMSGFDRENPDGREAGAHDTSPRDRAGVREANSRDIQEGRRDAA